jgi:hypothetical protein
VGRQRGRRGRAGHVVFGAMAEAVRREINHAVAYWSGATPGRVSLWRRTLDVRPTNAGAHRPREEYRAEP